MWASPQITGKARHSCQWDSATGRVLLEPHFLQENRDSLGSWGQGALTLPSDHPPGPHVSAPQWAEPCPHFVPCQEGTPVPPATPWLGCESVTSQDKCPSSLFLAT